MEWLSKSDPFAKFYRHDNLDQKLLIHETNVIDNNLDPVWNSWKTSV